MNVNRVLNRLVIVARLLARPSRQHGPSGGLFGGRNAVVAPPGTARATMSRPWTQSKSFFTRKFDVVASRLIRLATGHDITRERTHYGTKVPDRAPDRAHYGTTALLEQAPAPPTPPSRAR